MDATRTIVSIHTCQYKCILMMTDAWSPSNVNIDFHNNYINSIYPISIHTSHIRYHFRIELNSINDQIPQPSLFIASIKTNSFAIHLNHTLLDNPTMVHHVNYNICLQTMVPKFSFSFSIKQNTNYKGTNTQRNRNTIKEIEKLVFVTLANLQFAFQLII